MKTQEYRQNHANSTMEKMREIDDLKTEKEKDKALLKLAQDIHIKFDPPTYPKMTTEKYFKETNSKNILPHSIKTWDKSLTFQLAFSKEFPLKVSDFLSLLKCVTHSNNKL